MRQNFLVEINKSKRIIVRAKNLNSAINIFRKHTSQPFSDIRKLKLSDIGQKEDNLFILPDRIYLFEEKNSCRLSETV